MRLDYSKFSQESVGNNQDKLRNSEREKNHSKIQYEMQMDSFKDQIQELQDLLNQKDVYLKNMEQQLLAEKEGRLQLSQKVFEQQRQFEDSRSSSNGGTSSNTASGSGVGNNNESPSQSISNSHDQQHLIKELSETIQDYERKYANLQREKDYACSRLQRRIDVLLTTVSRMTKTSTTTGNGNGNNSTLATPRLPGNDSTTPAATDILDHLASSFVGNRIGNSDDDLKTETTAGLSRASSDALDMVMTSHSAGMASASTSTLANAGNYSVRPGVARVGEKRRLVHDSPAGPLSSSEDSGHGLGPSPFAQRFRENVRTTKEVLPKNLSK